jgi:Zn-dependent protease with chaperone function
MSKSSELKIFRSHDEITFLTLGIIISLIIAYITFDIYSLLPFILALGVIIYIIFVNASFIGNALAVDEGSLPTVHKSMEEIALKLGIAKPKLYIVQSPEVNAYTLGLLHPSIIITSGLLDMLDEEELKFVIAHEMGHVLFKHYTINTLISPAGNKIFGASYIFGFWSRLTEYSADKIGLFCSGNIDVALSALVKISVGQKTFKNMNISHFIKQVHKIDDPFEIIGETISDHPYTVKRIYTLIEYYAYNKERINGNY